MKTNLHISLIFAGLILLLLITENSNAQQWNNWIKCYDNPVMEGDVANWNIFLYDPQVLYENGVFKMWFNGVDTQIVQIGYAESYDGIS